MHPFCYVVCGAAVEQPRRKSSASRCKQQKKKKKKACKSRVLVCVWDDCTVTMWRRGVGSPFTAWPISDHCPFREASANQEALQGPIPHPTNLLTASSFLLPWRLMLYLLPVQSNYVSIIYVDTLYVVAVVVVNSFETCFVVFPDVKACEIHICMF